MADADTKNLKDDPKCILIAWRERIAVLVLFQVSQKIMIVFSKLFYVFLIILKDSLFTLISENISIQQCYVVTNTTLYVIMIKC